MSPIPRVAATVWIRALLGLGAILAIALLTQTVVNYQYVSSSLIRQEARRAAEERVRNVERAARLAQAGDADALRTILEDLHQETRDQLASITLVQADGAVLAGSGQSVLSTADRQRLATDRSLLTESQSVDGRSILTGIFACRCGPARAVRLFLEVAIYRDSLSAPFARVRRNAGLSAAAALALLIAVGLIALRFGPYVRGQQLAVQMEIARQVQRDLLPAVDRWPAGVDVAAECLPAASVGGDFYDVVSLPGGRVSFTLGDVSGHGISSALLMGLIHGAMSSPPWGAEGSDPERGAALLNDLLLAKSSDARFASLFWCDYDPGTGLLRYVNAGHLPPLWIRAAPDGRTVVHRLSDGGPVLGVLDYARYATATVTAAHGDFLVLFSDGIVETADTEGDLFGDERLIAVVQQHALAPARTICDAIMTTARTFGDNRPALDDQTVLVVRLWRTGLHDVMSLGPACTADGDKTPDGEVAPKEPNGIGDDRGHPRVEERCGRD